MTERKRILLNVLATYGRSLYALVLGLFSGRWALMALGEVDYGIYGLVGGLTVFITFFNRVLAGANARFYAISIGASRTAGNSECALEECRHWFNTALTVHSIVPLVLVAFGYFLGVYAIAHWLTLPQERIADSVWVFRFACASCLVSMLNVPFSAMYNAKQYIAELTIYSFITSTINVFVLYYMVSHSGNWLATYAGMACLLVVVPQILICARALYIFPECKIRLKYMFDFSRIKRLGGFAGWQMLGVFCGMLRGQGISILINKFFDARMNAAQTIGNSVLGHSTTLSGALQTSLVPVITQACGEGDYAKMNRFVIRMEKFGLLLSLVFVIPLSVELPEIIKLWLKHPPEFAVGLCYFAIFSYLVSVCTVGHTVAINAVGKIAMFHVVVCSINILTLPVALLVGVIWRNIYIISLSVVAFDVILSMGRLVFAQIICKTSIEKWMKHVFLPVLLLCVCSYGIGILPSIMFTPSLWRIVMSTMVCEIVFIPLSWHIILTGEERKFIRGKIVILLQKIK